MKLPPPDKVAEVRQPKSIFCLRLFEGKQVRRVRTCDCGNVGFKKQGSSMVCERCYNMDKPAPPKAKKYVPRGGMEEVKIHLSGFGDGFDINLI